MMGKTPWTPLEQLRRAAILWSNSGLPNLNGTEVIARLRAARPLLPHSVITGSFPTQEGCPPRPPPSGGPTAVMATPVDPDALIETLADLRLIRSEAAGKDTRHTRGPYPFHGDWTDAADASHDMGLGLRPAWVGRISIQAYP
jgi:CheY-like chemotaxis protein